MICVSYPWSSSRCATRLAILGVAVAIVSAALAWEVPGSVLRPGERQLFLDDFVIGDVNAVTRVIHQPTKYAGNPVIRSDLPTDGTAIQSRNAPDWDEQEKVWKIWYFCTDENVGGARFARSKDGVHWEKPELGVVEFHGNRKNNLVFVKNDPKAFIEHVFIDPHGPAERRFKGMIGSKDRRPIVSADGYTFTALNVPVIPSQDESHLGWDELGKQYLMTVKHNGPFGRSVYLTLSKDFEHWSDPELIYYADAQDQRLGEEHIQKLEANPRMWRPTINTPSEYNVEIYNMAVFVYEGLYIGTPNYFESSGRIPLPIGNQDGTNSLKLTCSRNLRAWTRVGDRTHFLPISEMGPGVIDTGQIMATSHPIRMGDELWFYYSGLDVRHRPKSATERGPYHGGIHLAKLRLDGFVSMRADAGGGFLDTRPMQLDGRHLMINGTATGEIRAEIVDRDGRQPLPGWSAADCAPVAGDNLKAELRWKGRDLKELAGQTVRVRFQLKAADLYSFWLEP